jgi:TldD protein
MALDERELADLSVDTALKAGADYAEARLQWNMENEVLLKNGELDPPGYGEVLGLSMRVTYKGAMTFGAVNTLTADSAREMATNLVKRAKTSISGFRQKVNLSAEEPHVAKWGAPESKKLEDVDLNTMVSSLKDVDNELVSSLGKERLPFRLFNLRLSVEEKYFVTSEGAKLESRVPRVGLFALLTGMESGSVVQRFVQCGAAGGWEVFERLKMKERLKEEAETVVRILTKATKFVGEEMDVVVGPEVAGIMTHESVGHPGEADRILGREGAQAGESYLSPSDLGLKVGSESVTIADDPTIPGSQGFYLYDDEGVPARKRILIKEGRINEFLQNRETASVFGIRSNSAARASLYAVEPIVRMANTYVEPGDMHLEEMLKEVKSGILIKSFMEWNIDDKRFNQRFVGHEAYRIVNGELKELVRNPVLEVTTPKLWGSVSGKTREVVFDAATCGKGDPSQGIPVWHGGPFMLLRSIRLSSR